MDHKQVKESLLDYLENTMGSPERDELEAHLQECEECRDVLRQYRGIVALEKTAASCRPYLTEDLSGRVMEAIRQFEDNSTPLPEGLNRAFWLVGGLASVNAVLALILVLMIHRAYTPQSGPIINVREPSVSKELLTPAAAKTYEQPLVPAGYKPLKVALPSTQGIEQLLRKDAVIDVKCIYEQNGERHDAIIARMVQVLSVQVMHQLLPADFEQNPYTVLVVLLVPERDARRVELSRLLGDLNLSVLVPPSPSGERDRTGSMAIYDPSGRPVTSDAGVDSLAVMYSPDPRTGAQTRRVLVEGVWKEEKGIELTAF